MIYSAVIVEDEARARARLKRLLEAHKHQVNVVGEASDGLNAVEIISNLKPDVIFLDVDVPGFDGFEILKKLELSPKVIFTTAHSDYAVKAFKTNVVDFLLKPFDADDLQKTMDKLMASSPAFNFDLAMGLMQQKKEPDYISKIPAKVGETIYLVDVNDVHFFQSDTKLTKIKTSEKEYFIDTPLVDLEKKLDPKTFSRIHRSIIVNVNSIVKIKKAYEGKLYVYVNDESKTELVSSRSHSHNLKYL